MFQDSEDYMAEKVASLVARGLLASTPSDQEIWVEITDAGREMHGQALAEIGPEVEQLLEGIDLDDLQISLRVLQDIRRTLDNLPDR
jgi:DNA-binding MarR family transcriptional regulator